MSQQSPQVLAQRQRNSSQSPPGSRQLATALDHSRPESNLDPIPFDSSTFSRPSSTQQSRSALPEYDPSNFVHIPISMPQPQLQFNISHKSGTPADLSDLQQHLYACVQIGRMDRAALLARRITDMFVSTAGPVIDAHHRYLSGCLDQLQSAPSQEKLMEMQKWLELDVRTRGIPVGHGIIALMLKASLLVLKGPRLDRTIRRYAMFAQQLSQDTYEDTLSSSIFTDQEMSKILKALNRDFATPNEELSEQDIEELDQANRIAWERETGVQRPAPETKHLPDLKPVDLKGLGLDALKKSLGSLQADYLDESNYPSDTESMTQRQMRLEQDVADAALERWRTESEDFEQTRNEGRLSQAPIGSQIHQWVQQMVPQLEEELKHAEDPEAYTPSEDYDIVAAAPFLKMMAPEKVAAVAVLQFFAGIMDPSTRKEQRADRIAVVRLCERMGMSLFREVRIDQIQTHHLQSLSNLPSGERHKQLSRLLRGKKWSSRHLEAHYAKMIQSSPASDVAPWEQNHTMAMQCGAVLLGLILKTAKVTTNLPDAETSKRTLKTQPIGTRVFDWRKGKKVGTVQVPPELLQILQKEPVASLVAKHLPMIVPPKPWKNVQDGGYLSTSVPVVRFTDFQTTQKAYAQLAHQRGDMDRLYAGLDVISKTPWHVNNDLLRIMTEVWNSGERMGKIAPDKLETKLPERPDTDDPKVIHRWRNIVTSMQNDIASNHSQRCYQNFQLEVARAFANTTFYCPQNVDYRGRAYPIPPYFNHTGADYVRALFNFAEGKELGPEGLYWLKVQLANTYGYDKASLSDRAKFVDDNMEHVIDSATNPLQGSRWWLNASDPWQALAACLDLKAALDLPDPTKHVSHLPIQQDGSCNGLQHYAALGGDEIGARQVNLTPSDKPADIYTAVMESVAKIVHQDALAGDVRAQHVDGYVARKMVKQPVMTNVYGVTYHGAIHQVAKQLREIIPESQRAMNPEATTYKLASYVATCIFKALSEMFTGAQAIQIWLGECGARISSAVTPEQIKRARAKREGIVDPEKEARQLYKKSLFFGANKRSIQTPEDTSFKSTIIWTTPLGFSVVQPYREFHRKSVKTHLQHIRIFTPTGSDPVNKRKQLQGFPPNFIHSLDATHMMLSALKCDEIGLTFSSVHDSFWTHAADVPTLNKVLRDAFVSMHKEDIIRRLKEEFEARYAGCFEWTSVLRQSDAGRKLVQYYKDVKGRKHAQYTKKTVTGGFEIDDLLDEAKRAELLKSEDPEQQEKGREMMTAARVVEESAVGDDAVHSTEEWGRYIAREGESSGPLTGKTNEESPEDKDAFVAADEAAFEPEQDPLAADDASAEEVEQASPKKQSKSTKTRASSKVKPKIEVAEDDASSEPSQTTDSSSGDQKTKSTQSVKDQVRKKQVAKERVYFWRPLTFPEPPPKGKFDVTCLTESRYFFS
ncbi:MAG: hypothetical protein Q9159_004511 [Coniocarpon cinnabarinum]